MNAPRCADCRGRGFVRGQPCEACLTTGRTLDVAEYIELAPLTRLSDVRAGRSGVRERTDGNPDPLPTGGR